MSVDLITNNGIQNAQAIYDAAKAFNVPLEIAVAFADQESDGYMVYGHDPGGTFSTLDGPVAIAGKLYPKGSNVPVTPENYWGTTNERGFFNRVARDGQKSCGVGIYQLTYVGYLREAREKGYDLATAEGNAKYGLSVIKSLLRDDSDDSIKRAACYYNTGSYDGYGAQWYALEILEKVNRWRAILSGDPIPGNATTTSWVNMRSGPGMSNAVIVAIPDKTPVTTTGQVTNGWHEVYYSSRYGWVFGDYLYIQPEPVKETPKQSTVHMYAKEWLNVRSGVGSSYPVVTIIKPGDRVETTGKVTKGWYELTYNGKKGWSNGVYLTALAPQQK